MQAGLINQLQLKHALDVQTKEGGRLGSILSSLGFVKPLQMIQTVASQQSIRHIDLHKEPADDYLMSYEELDYYLAYRCIPWRIENARGRLRFFIQGIPDHRKCHTIVDYT